MNYNEYISSLEVESLKILAENYNIDYISNVNWSGDEGEGLRLHLIDVFKNITNLENIVQALDSEAKNLMKIIFFSDEPADQDDIIRKFNNLYGKDNNIRISIDTLWKKGIILKFEMFYKNRPYIGLVDEVKPIVARFISDELAQRVLPPTVDSFITATPYELSQDIYVYLSYVNNNDPKLTIKNLVFKKAAHKIESTFIGTSSYIDDPNSDYTERFNFINSFLYMVDMVTYDNYNIYLNQLKVDKWLSLKLSKKMNAVNDFLKKYYLGSKREITEAIDKIIMILFGNTDHPILMGDFLNIIKKYSADMNFSYIQSNAEKIINHLVLIGMANFYKDADENLYFSLNKYGQKFYSGRGSAIDEEEEDCFYIQPNFEVISTINLSPKLRWELDNFADLKKLDKTLHYTITKNSIFRALSNGKNLDDILSLLKEHTKSGMPQNIEYTIKEWATGYGNVYLMDNILLRSVSPILIKEICSIPEINEHVIEHITDKDIIIDKRYASAVLDIIMKKGYMANPNIVTAINKTVTHTADSLDNLIADILGPSKPVKAKDEFKVDKQYLDNNEHFKETVMEIKPMTKEEKEKSIAMKIYSPSVFQAKDIIEKSIDQNKSILVDYLISDTENINKIHMSPSSVNRTDDNWTVTGFDNISNQEITININNIQSIEFSNN